MTLFCEQRELNSEIIFVPISEYNFGYYVVNGIKYQFWLNAYFVKELHRILKCLWACLKLKSLPQRFENENAYINEMDLVNGFGQASSGFGSDPPTWSGQARGSLHLNS